MISLPILLRLASILYSSIHRQPMFGVHPYSKSSSPPLRYPRISMPRKQLDNQSMTRASKSAVQTHIISPPDAQKTAHFMTMLQKLAHSFSSPFQNAQARMSSATSTPCSGFQVYIHSSGFVVAPYFCCRSRRYASFEPIPEFCVLLSVVRRAGDVGDREVVVVGRMRVAGIAIADVRC